MENVMAYLISNVNDAIKFLKNRNMDYTEDTYTEDIDMDYFQDARSMTAVKGDKVYIIDSLTTLAEVAEIENILNNDTFDYIVETSNDIDNIVGDIREFLDGNNIQNDDRLSVYRYEQAAKKLNYNFTKESILNELK